MQPIAGYSRLVIRIVSVVRRSRSVERGGTRLYRRRADTSCHRRRPGARLACLGRHARFWSIAIPRFLTDPAWQTFSFFIPLYLMEAKGMDLKAIAAFACLAIFDLIGAAVLWILPRPAAKVQAHVCRQRAAMPMPPKHLSHW